MPSTAVSPSARIMTDRIESRAPFDILRYANCWEDADILCEALEPKPGRRILSIASAGDNSFALAAEGAELIAADLSEAQIACVELKRVACRRLEYEDFLAFLGVRQSKDRLATYEKLKRELPQPAHAFWDTRPGQVADGIIHAGKFENYLRIWRTRIMPLIHRSKTIEQQLNQESATRRRESYDATWNNHRWRLLFRLFFSRFVLGRFGRDPEFFRYVEDSVADRLLARAEYALTVLPTHSNPYLQYILRGNFSPALPRYLRPENFSAVRAGMQRMTLFHGPIQKAARQYSRGKFHGYNLSDIFEYLDSGTCTNILAAILETAQPGARLAYWNMLVCRRCPAELAQRIRSLDEFAGGMFKRDLAFFYSAFVVEEVR